MNTPSLAQYIICGICSLFIYLQVLLDCLEPFSKLRVVVHRPPQHLHLEFPQVLAHFQMPFLPPETILPRMSTQPR